MIAGGFPEVKRLENLVTTLILQDPCIMAVQSLYQTQKKEDKIVLQCIVYMKCPGVVTAETDRVVLGVLIRSLR